MERAVANEPAPHCPCTGLIKPDVVFFGEPVKGLERAAAAVGESDLLLVLGSSLKVYPAAFLPEQAQGDVVVVNQGEVGLRPGPRRFFVDANLDEFFDRVRGHMES
jgi:NAD-dependent deacetylase